MDFDKAVKDVQKNLKKVRGQAEDAVKVSFKTIKAANDVVISGVQGLFSTQTEAAKDLYTAGKDSLDRAWADGLLAVVKSPIEYLPEGRETVVDALNDTVTTFTKTGEKLVKVVKKGYEGVVASFKPKPARKAKKTARKTTRKTTAKPRTTTQAAA